MLLSRNLLVFAGVCMTLGTGAIAQNEPLGPPTRAVQGTRNVHDQDVAIPPQTLPDAQRQGALFNESPPFLPLGGPNVDCVCDQRFNRGDRVVSSVDMPDGNSQIRIGDLGTVVCGREFGVDDLVLVRWDITNGHDGFDACTCPTDELPTGSSRGWYVFCGELERAADNTIDCVCDEDYSIGQTVVAAVDNPDGNPQILAGDTGTVICGREFSPDGLVLVSWDIDNGHDGFVACDCPGDELPTGSNNGWYVTCDEIRGIQVDEVCVCSGLITGRTVISAVSNPDGNPQIVAGDSGTLICGREFGDPDLALVAWDINNGHDGFGACTCPTEGLPAGSATGWFVFCDEFRQIDPLDIDCVCPDQYDVGDKVVSLVDDLNGNAQIDAGHVGTVICGREFGASDLILVAWDIDNGHDGFDACTCPTQDLPSGSNTGWYVFCGSVAVVGDGPIDCVCDADLQPGDEVRSAVDNPDGNPQILAGDTGTVICGREFGATDLILVAWDIENGHDGFDACTCPTDELPAGSITGWYVFCEELVLVSDCLGDIDASGTVGFPDLLRVLSLWGPCVGCPEDLDDDGQVGFSDLLIVLSSWGPCP